MLGWIDKRTGFITMAQEFLTEDVPGGASYWYVFGSATLFAVIVQIVTGIFLTFFYAPSASTAWESTKAIYDNPFQHYMLSIHYWGASAMIALVFLHLLQVLIWGAYKAPRELQWIVGVILLLVTLALGLTGYLLPWDMNAYFASQVSLNITGGAPVLGPLLQNIAQGGGVMGTNTINRFFGLHVWLMPAALLGLVGAHLAIFRHNGSAGPVVEDPRALKPGRFFPNQIFMDTVVSFLVFVVILFLAAFAPPFLDAKADPNVFFIPYPAWYFLSLFGLLNLVPPELDLLATIGIPTIFILVVLALPWLDRSTTRSYGSRKPILWGTFVVVCVIVGLSIYSQISIVGKQAQAATTPVAPAPVSAAAVPGGGGTVATTANGGSKVYAQNCSGCHGATGLGQPGAIPPLANNPFVVGDQNKVIRVVLNGLHGNVAVNGAKFNGVMPAWKASLSNSDVASVITYIRGSLGTNKADAVKESAVAALKK
ncbi:MAG: cytochrome b N-terminal domain-containing protein [Candidatus Baltobacteraceae bacterium]